MQFWADFEHRKRWKWRYFCKTIRYLPCDCDILSIHLSRQKTMHSGEGLKNARISGWEMYKKTRQCTAVPRCECSMSQCNSTAYSVPRRECSMSQCNYIHDRVKSTTDNCTTTLSCAPFSPTPGARVLWVTVHDSITNTHTKVCHHVEARVKLPCRCA